MGDVTNLALCHSKFISLLLLSKLASRRPSLTGSPTGYLNVWPLPEIARHFQHLDSNTPNRRLYIPLSSRDPDPFYQQIKESTSSSLPWLLHNTTHEY
jgi:hypothetical protein